MSIERELGALTEAVGGLKKGQEDLGKKVDGLDVKFDRHLEAQAKKDASINFKIGKLAGTIALVTSLFLAGAKEVLARLFNP